MSIGLLGKKLGMSQIFKPDGIVVPVTVIEAGPCTVLQRKEPAADGYRALQLGFEDTPESRATKPLLGHFKKAGVSPKRFIKEIRLNGEEMPQQVGSSVTVELFAAGDYVDITGRSIGKGFQGGMKRWHWRGGPGSHGSTSHRRVGSIGSSTTPGRVWRGHHLPGRMGGQTTTIQNLEVVQVNKEHHLLLVRGAVPGHVNSYLVIQKSFKKKPRPAGVAPVVKKEKKISEAKAARKASKALTQAKPVKEEKKKA